MLTKTARLDPTACTMRAVADNLGVSIMTVSRALRNAPNVAQKTRESVIAEAKRLNFQPDPALGVLNAYRHGRRDRKTHEQIVFITNFPQPNGWKKIVTFVRYFEGAKRRAEQLGYSIEPFWVGDPALTPRRASQILRDRGIRGLLVGPLAKGNTSLTLEWDWFSSVAIGRSLISPKITTVSTNHFQGALIAWDALIERGFRRIGFAITHYEDARTQSALRAAYLLQQSQHTDAKIPVYLTNDFSAPGITRWAKSHRPEVIISSESSHYDLLPAKMRAEIGFVHLNIDPTSNGAGLDQAHDLVGEQAAALLHLKLIQRQTGVLKQREMFLVDGVWQDGVIHHPVSRDPSRRLNAAPNV